MTQTRELSPIPVLTQYNINIQHRAITSTETNTMPHSQRNTLNLQVFTNFRQIIEIL